MQGIHIDILWLSYLSNRFHPTWSYSSQHIARICASGQIGIQNVRTMLMRQFESLRPHLAQLPEKCNRMLCCSNKPNNLQIWVAGQLYYCSSHFQLAPCSSRAVWCLCKGKVPAGEKKSDWLLHFWFYLKVTLMYEVKQTNKKYMHGNSHRCCFLLFWDECVPSWDTPAHFTGW